MAPEKKNINSIGFRLNKVTTEQFATIKDSYDGSIESINMAINLKFGLDKENQLIASFVKVQFEQKGMPFLIVEVGNHFKINETSWNDFQKTDDKIILPQGFATHLVMLTIGTLRGVLHSKTENSEFNKFFLPAINVTELIKSDIELS